MRLLLDTHVALWAISDSPHLSARARALVVAPDNQIHVSAASLWEIAIKHALHRTGPGAMTLSAEQASRYFERAGFSLVSITPAHARAVERLPDLHHDPFDRILVAQALEEPFRLVTHDARVGAYSATVLMV